MKGCRLVLLGRRLRGVGQATEKLQRFGLGGGGEGVVTEIGRGAAGLDVGVEQILGADSDLALFVINRALLFALLFVAEGCVTGEDRLDL